jgi:high-affinity Fe2+/Pb2+ permease
MDAMLPSVTDQIITGLLLLVVVLLAVLAFWDMRRRGQRGWPYGVLTLLAPPIGIAVWIIQATWIERHYADGEPHEPTDQGRR